jgi:hypothetical protein
MQRVLFAELAVLFDFNTIRIVFLIFGRLVVTLLAYGAGQGNANTIVICCHFFTPHLLPKIPKVAYIDYHTRDKMSTKK